MSSYKKLEDLTGRDALRGGQWFLGKNQELYFRRKGLSEKTSLRADILAAKPDALVVSLAQDQQNQKVSGRTVKLDGKWQADEHNRLAFFVQKERV